MRPEHPRALLETPRLYLRRFRTEDVPTLASYRSDPEVARYQSWTVPVSAEAAASLVRRFTAGDPERPGWFQYAVQHRAEGCLIGDVGVNLHENRMQADLGFTFATRWQGRGHATEAVCAVLRELFERRGLRRVSAECDARNTRSARLLQRVGFQREGLRRQHTWIKGEWTDDLLYGLLVDDWGRRGAGRDSPGAAGATQDAPRR
ncbi:GNAT family N-acetyltransferase [Wenjunlia vitaminophila]|uniref:GNAT family N-acetyltransferase n=1 Tax=Wenjunlia vitaminophila TaxID=76728 RepID=UPI000363BDEC|nr:GNAT family protein [Wenjunlia vitaminophila]